MKTETRPAACGSPTSPSRWRPRSAGTRKLPRPDPAAPGSNFPVELWNLLGGSVPFARQEILDRYGDRDGYLELVQECAAELVGRRHLLDEDVGHVVDHARALWERAMAPEPAG